VFFFSLIAARACATDRDPNAQKTSRIQLLAGVEANWTLRLGQRTAASPRARGCVVDRSREFWGGREILTGMPKTFISSFFDILAAFRTERKEVSGEGLTELCD